MTDELLIQAGLAAVSHHNAGQALREARHDLAEAERGWCEAEGIERRRLEPDVYASMRADCAVYHEPVRLAKRAQYNAKRRLETAVRRVSHLVF